MLACGEKVGVSFLGSREAHAHQTMGVVAIKTSDGVLESRIKLEDTLEETRGRLETEFK